jgi:hypothetical protein
MTAEEYYNKTKRKPTGITLHTPTEMCEFAEAYHKTKVERVTDEAYNRGYNDAMKGNNYEY